MKQNKEKLFIMACIGTLLLSACGKNAREQDVTRDEPFLLTEELRQTIQLDTVKNQTLQDEILLNGRVGFDQERVVPVYTIFSGRVEQIYFEAGDYVKQGELLATVRSEEVAALEKALREAEQAVKVANRHLEATEEMAAGGILSERDLLEARQEAAKAEAEAKRIRKLQAIHSMQEGTYFEVKSPISGFVIDRTINPHVLLRSDRAEPIFTIASLDQVWITADVYESEISLIHKGMPVRITTLAYGMREFQGKIDRIYQVLEESKTMSVRIELDNREQLLKPGMFANVYVQTNEAGEEFPCVDSKAIIFENGRHYVISLQKNNELKINPVEIKKQTADICYLKNGIHAGDVIITRNALLIYNALK